MTDQSPTPIVFLSHASEDVELAHRLAKALFTKGIETFFAEWEIRSGQSIRRRIEDGLQNCTHFVVLLTTASIQKSWVNEEIDAAFIRKVEGACRFIPLRSGIAHTELPPLLRSIHSPMISDEKFESQLNALIGDIYEVSRRPALGPRPNLTHSDLIEQSGCFGPRVRAARRPPRLCSSKQMK